ncbi:MAG: DUF2520 domain-containing protein [Actinobacteria bacterium]|nr:MAG: DUF2520 domain-containing protein [Actinomycetota bacterium]
MDNAPLSSSAEAQRLAVVGRGRVGTALAGALRAAGHTVEGPLGHEPDVSGADVVLLCVPDSEIVRAAAALAPGRLVGHCSGATGLEALAPHERFSLHPLMTLAGLPPAAPGQGAGPDPTGPLRGAGCAIAGSSPRARTVAEGLARSVGMRPFEVGPEDRAAYHAAAALASNFLVTLESAAERLAATAGVDRAELVPLVRATVENWARAGAGALTGPIARGDHATVQRHRAAVLERAPDLLELFDALAAATAALAPGASAAAGADPRQRETEAVGA